MESFIFWASLIFAAIWTIAWFLSRKESVGHSVQIISASSLWAVVGHFYVSPQISKFHMLWAIPAAFVSSFSIQILYIRRPLRRSRESMASSRESYTPGLLSLDC